MSDKVSPPSFLELGKLAIPSRPSPIKLVLRSLVLLLMYTKTMIKALTILRWPAKQISASRKLTEDRAMFMANPTSATTLRRSLTLLVVIIYYFMIFN